MSRHLEVDHQFVEVLPAVLEPGLVYISGTHNIAAHLCCCGCDEEIVTPLGKAGWTLHYDGQVTLSPSIGNGALACRSHYIIRDSQIRWLSEMTEKQHARAHARDHAAVQELHAMRGPRLAQALRAIFNWLR
ncbi:DUF6527 family protein [Microbacterium sp. KSW4-11]|uniref:DUF6527 family protein n=1 Tax=Microbacterium gawkjiense TaxID=3067309 RepID=A0ABU3G749_9MICO|nr:DUF6527 family protein [Microbacterium sp. KSW4-11]MDT3315652.1 DUF6527 family protein [Microbacterium sp. KSW4-11]